MEHKLSDEHSHILAGVAETEYYSDKERLSAGILLDLHQGKSLEDICSARDVKKASITICVKRWVNHQSLIGKKSIIGGEKNLSEQQAEQLESMLTAHGVKDLDRVRAHILLLLDDGSDHRKIIEDYQLDKLIVGKTANFNVSQIDSLIFTYYRPLFSEDDKEYLKAVINDPDERATSPRKKSSKVLLLMSAGMNDAEISRTTELVRDRVKLERHRIFKHGDAPIQEYFKRGIGE